MNSESFLQNIFLFQNLSDEQAQLIRGLLKEQIYHANEKIVEEGKAGESLYVIVSGKVRVTREFDRESFVLTELGPYDFFGEMSLIDDFATSATVEAMTETRVLKMDRHDFKAVVSSNTDLSSRLWESLARSLNRKIRKTGDLVKMYYGLNKALCENEQFRQLYTSWNFHPRE
jgi:CRP/FNR family transcriptional regulator, cyclic AMP receptor protein